MSKTMIDIDDALLDEVKGILGTATKKDTVNAALHEVADREHRRRAVEAFRGMDFLAHMADRSARAHAWGQDR